MNKLKGDIYELFINHYLNSLDDTKRSYLWNDVPEYMLYNANIITSYNEHRLKRKTDKTNPLQDVGIDILCVNKDNTIDFVQCKNYEKTIKIKHLSGFFMVMSKFINNKGYVYYTNTISRNIKENIPKRITLVKRQLETLESEHNFSLYDYQKKIINLYEDYYKEDQKAILATPCGTGKTLMSCFISMKYNFVIIISPLKQFAEQNIDKFTEYDENRKCLLVDSDGTRNITEIIEFIGSHDRVLLSATYKSCDIIRELIEGYEYPNHPFIIIDEFHNLSYNNIYNEDDDINVIINCEYKMLSMSATPRIYELEGENDCDVNDILGETVYKMDFKEAIEKGYICDYKIYLPVLGHDEEYNEIIKDFKYNDMNKKCCYLFECIKKLGTLKCILYFRSHEEINNFIERFNELDNNYYYYDLWIESMTCNDNKKQRKNKINKFKENNVCSFLCSVSILDECVDIPECNSIFITYNCKSKVRNIQRMSRSMRKDKNNVKKEAKIILWCDEMDEILTIMSAIKEIDLDYSKKIKCIHISSEFGNKKIVDECSKEYVKSNVGVREYRGFNWMNMLEKAKQFIDENKKRPSTASKNIKEKHLSKWIAHQKVNYEKVEYCMKNKTIYQKWKMFVDEYKKYFKSNIEVWNETFEKVKLFVNTHDKLPSPSENHKDNNKLCGWVTCQMARYKKRQRIMKVQMIYDKWSKFVCDNDKFFKNNIEVWNETLEKIKTFFNTCCKYPSKNSKDEEIKKLYGWLETQKTNFRRKDNIMKNNEIYDKWKEFVDQYKEYFKSNVEIWHDNLVKLKLYIDTYNKLPSAYLHETKQLYNWLANQKNSCKKREQIMKIPNIYEKWTEFTNEYKKYFKSDEESWYDMFDKVTEYITNKKKKPPYNSKNTEEKQIYTWISKQQNAYKNEQKNGMMRNQKIYDKWTKFVDDHKEYFMTNSEL